MQFSAIGPKDVEYEVELTDEDKNYVKKLQSDLLPLVLAFDSGWPAFSIVHSHARLLARTHFPLRRERGLARQNAKRLKGHLPRQSALTAAPS